MTIPPCFSFLKKISRFPWPLRQGALLFAFTAFVILPGTAEPKKELPPLLKVHEAEIAIGLLQREDLPLHDSYALQQKLPARIAVVTQERPVPPKEEPPQKTVTVLTISAAGDCTLGTDESFGYEGTFPASYDAANGDASVFLKGVASIFAHDDLTLVNMEGALTESTDRQDKTFAFKGKADYVRVLTEGSVEAATLANNHSYDYGNEGYWDTFGTLGKAGVMPFGYEESPVMLIKGIPVGLIGINDLTGGAETQLIAELEKVKRKGARLIICYFHWGTELEPMPTRTSAILPILPSTTALIWFWVPIPTLCRERRPIKGGASSTVWEISASAATAIPVTKMPSFTRNALPLKMGTFMVLMAARSLLAAFPRHLIIMTIGLFFMRGPKRNGSFKRLRTGPNEKEMK